ncbi:MAG: tRNA (adenosine(37)-N6)-threonylcarbamoyltransferase complex transferase subunit TsaD [Bacteroidales bacterium]|nr:tRNA (adenosine(37)-N6)-threonylcarbamoyltransferase complex transferase subunit TsaD [Bacteroidales bacterium]
MSHYILGIESSCDDTSAAVIKDNVILSNIIANQKVHENYGGVVPELASRAHQQNIIPVIDQAIDRANIKKKDIHAVAFTRGPGLLGSLLVGVSFAKAFALSMGIPIVEIDHLEAHILAHFIQNRDKNLSVPAFPFLCLTVSGGHTQIVKVRDYFQMEIIGQTIDDAAGEAFDKAAKIMSLPYPGGPVIDKMAKQGDAGAFHFPKPSMPRYNYSFSGLKTSILYFLRDELKKDPDFIEKNKNNLAASIQKAIIDILMEKLVKASDETGIKEIAIAGGVSANSGFREAVFDLQASKQWNIYLPKLEYSTDNAAMIAIAGYYKYLKKDLAGQEVTPYARSSAAKK